jgi:hypothetical protein
MAATIARPIVAAIPLAPRHYLALSPVGTAMAASKRGVTSHGGNIVYRASPPRFPIEVSLITPGGNDGCPFIPSFAQEHPMNTPKTKPAKKRPASAGSVTLSSIAARVLGRCRVMEGESFPARRIGLEFPSLNAVELESVLGELVDKQLVIETGYGDRASYAITERGKEARVSVA